MSSDNDRSLAESEVKIGVITRRDLAGTEIERRAETTATAAAAQVRAQMEFHYLMALRAPRDLEEVELRLLKECDRPAFAREALYNKPIGKGVMGLSIRFAEKALMCMRNMASDTIVTFDDDQKRIVRQVVTDFESNVTFSKDVTINKTVERRQVKEGQEIISRRMNSRGEMVHLVAATEDDLLNKEGALISKAMRTNVLRVLPGDIQARCREKILKILRDQHAQDPEGRKKAMLAAFYELGVKPKDISEVLGHDLDSPITADEFINLQALHNAIKDGETNIREAIEFGKAQRGDASPVAEEVPVGGTATERVTSKLKKGATKRPTDDQAQDFIGRFMKLTKGNRAAADVEISTATAGQIQTLDAIPQALADKPEWIKPITDYLDGEEAS